MRNFSYIQIWHFVRVLPLQNIVFVPLLFVVRLLLSSCSKEASGHPTGHPLDAERRGVGGGSPSGPLALYTETPSPHFRNPYYAHCVLYLTGHVTSTTAGGLA